MKLKAIKRLMLAVCAAVAATVTARGELPAGYTQAAYIQSTGKQSIRTGYTPKWNDKITAKFEFTTISAIRDVGNQTIYCARGGNNQDRMMAFFLVNGAFRFDHGTQSSQQVPFQTPSSVGNIYNLAVDGGQAKATVTENGQPFEEKTTGARDFGAAGSEMMLFRSHSNGIDGNLNNWASIKLYSFKVEAADGTVQRDFVPCVRDADGEVGLYDLSGKSENPFYANYQKTGTEAFVAGVRSIAIDRVSPQVFDGEREYEPVPTVRSEGVVLSAENYEVTYANNTRKGFATVTATGRGAYEGCTSSRSFIIGAEKPFEVVTENGRTAYARLEDAVGANPADNTVIELVSDAEYDTSFVTTNRYVIRSCMDQESNPSGRRWTLLRQGPAVIKCDAYGASRKFGAFTVTNLVWDGGAVWKDADDFANPASRDDIGVSVCDLFALTGYEASWDYITHGTVTLQAGAVVRNVKPQSAVFALKRGDGTSFAYARVGAVVLEEGSLITDCRGAAPVIGESSSAIVGLGLLRLSGGSITRCCNTDATGIVYVPALSPNEHNCGCFFTGTAITNNVVGANGAVRVAVVNTSPNGRMFVSGTLRITDNHLGSPDGKPANLYEGSALVTVNAPLAEDALVGISYPAADAEIEAAVLGLYSYAGGDDPHLDRICHDANPIGGITYVGRKSGAQVVWADSQGQYDIVQGDVFEVWDVESESWIGYDRLEKAVAAAPEGGVIELVDNALYDASVQLTKALTIRSRGTECFTLKRFAPAELNVKQAQDNLMAGFTVILTNIVVDGGAVWTNPADLADASCTGVSGGCFARIGNGSNYPHCRLLLADGAEVVNFAFGTYLIHTDCGATLELGPGSLIRNCRGSVALLQIGWNQASVVFNGGTVAGNRASQLMWPASGGGSVTLDAGAITGNVVTVKAWGGDFSNWIGQRRRYLDTAYNDLTTPGRFIFKDNTLANGTAKNLCCGEIGVFAPLDPTSLIRIDSSSNVDTYDNPGKTFATVAAAVEGDVRPWVFAHGGNPILRGVQTEVEGAKKLIWAPVAVIGQTVELQSATERSGELHVSGLALDETVGQTDGYVLMTCAAGFTGEYEGLVIDDNLIQKETHRAYWKLVQTANEVRLVYRGPGLMLIYR